MFLSENFYIHVTDFSPNIPQQLWSYLSPYMAVILINYPIFVKSENPQELSSMFMTPQKLMYGVAYFITEL
jgi:hypothetical protein